MKSLNRALQRAYRKLCYWMQGYPVNTLYHEHRGSIEDLDQIKRVESTRFGDGSVITWQDGRKQTTTFSPQSVWCAIRNARRANRFNRVFHEAKQRRGK